jgi:hypothetical protein
MTWAKGQSGNPSGRPKIDAEIKAMFREHTPAALEALLRGLNDPDKYVTAAVAILDRGWGKPSQTHAGDPDLPQIIRIESVIVRPENTDS